MKMILVDDSLVELKLFEIECDGLPNFEIAGMFQDPMSALDFVKTHRDVDFALLDIDMPVMNGIELAAQLRKLRRDIIIIYVTAHTEFAAEAIRSKADFVVFKPFDREDVLDALQRAQLMQVRQRKRYYANLFDSFNLIADGKTVHFRSAKARELMALLICYRGKAVSIYDIVDRLWDGDAEADVRSVGYRKAIKNLADTLADYDAEQLLDRKRGFCRLRAELMDCDYYAFLRGDKEQIRAFDGVFLPEYPWAEPYIYPMLERKRELEGKAGGSD